LTFPQLEISIDTRVRAAHTCTHKNKQADAALISPSATAISNEVAFNQKQKETTSS